MEQKQPPCIDDATACPAPEGESRQVRRARERRKDKVISALDKINRSHQRMQAQPHRQTTDRPGHEEDLL